MRLELMSNKETGREVSGAKSGRTLGAVLRKLTSALESDRITLKT